MNIEKTIAGYSAPRAEARTSDKILWLSIIQGWAIFLVVLGHVNGFTYSGAERDVYPVAGWIQRFCYAFHMPLFMFVSGGLLYYSRIKKNWSTTSLYKDKVKRLLLPYLAFTVIGFLLKIPVSGISKRGMDISLNGFVDALIDPANGPLAELWFLGTLMWLMLMYPVYKTMLRNGWTEILLLAITLIPFAAGMNFDFDGWLSLANVPEYMLYFVAGILFFKHNGIEWFADRVWLTVLLTVAFFLSLTYKMPELATALLGIFMSMGWGGMLQRFPKLFSSFRDHSFQIFLVGIFPQMLIELLVWRKYHEEWMLLPYYVVSCVLALACGVIVSKTASRLPYKWMRWCFGVK